MNILMVNLHGFLDPVPDLTKPDTGGQTVHVVALARGLAALGHKVVVLTRWFDDRPALTEICPGAWIARLEDEGRWFVDRQNTWRMAMGFADEVLRGDWRRLDPDLPQDYDLVHSHYWDAGLAGERIAGGLDCPHVFTPHTLADRAGETHGSNCLRTTHSLRVTEEDRLIRAADVTITVSGQQKQRILAVQLLIQPPNLRVIPPAIDVTHLSVAGPLDDHPLRKSANFGHPSLLTACRCCEDKNLTRLVRAMALVHNERPTIRLTIATDRGYGHDGTADYRREINRLAGQLPRHVVTIVPPIPHDQVSAWYRAASAFILPSVRESFGLTAAEAAYCGTLPLISNRTGVSDILTAPQFDPFKIEEIAESIVTYTPAWPLVDYRNFPEELLTVPNQHEALYREALTTYRKPLTT